MTFQFLSRVKSGSNKSYRSDIDGLRAVAVLAVVGFHCHISWLKGGFVGVDVFFVISGYLICSILYKEIQSGMFSIARFYERRFKRILPALSVVLLFCLVLGFLVLSPFEARRLGDSAVATSLSLSNFLFIARNGYFAVDAAANPLLMTWSLAVEEQFYIVFPLLMFFLARNRSRRTLLIYLTGLSALSLMASIYAEFRQPIWNFYLPVTRAWELGAGTILAVWQNGKLGAEDKQSWVRNCSGIVGILLVFGSIFLYQPAMRFPGYEAIPPVLGAVFFLASPGSPANRFLSFRPVTAIGLISYSLYLWHWPLLSFAGILNAKPLRNQTLILLVAISFIAAIASYIFVERPFREFRRMRTSRLLLSYGGGLLCLTGIAGIFSLTHGLPSRNPRLYGIEQDAKLDRHHPCLVSGSEIKLTKDCVSQPVTDRPALAILGDSHAETFVDPLRAIASKDGWNLVALTRIKCPPLHGVSYWSPSGVMDINSCRQFNNAALDYVLTRPDIKIVMLEGHWGGGSLIPDGFQGNPAKQSPQEHAENLRQGLLREVSTLEAAGKKVVVIQDAPQFPYDPVADIRYKYMPVRRALNTIILADRPDAGDHYSEKLSSIATPTDSFSYDEISELRSLDPNVTVVDPKQVFCDNERCSYAGAKGLYYSDSGHLSEIGAMQVMPILEPLIKANGNGSVAP